MKEKIKVFENVEENIKKIFKFIKTEIIGFLIGYYIEDEIYIINFIKCKNIKEIEKEKKQVKMIIPNGLKIVGSKKKIIIKKKINKKVYNSQDYEENLIEIKKKMKENKIIIINEKEKNQYIKNKKQVEVEIIQENPTNKLITIRSNISIKKEISNKKEMKEEIEKIKKEINETLHFKMKNGKIIEKNTTNNEIFKEENKDDKNIYQFYTLKKEKTTNSKVYDLKIKEGKTLPLKIKKSKKKKQII
jgi:hypothetical protein